MVESNGQFAYSVPIRRKISRICDAFEDALAANGSPKIEDYFEKVSEPHRPGLFFELLRIEIETLDKTGQTTSPEAYCRRFPGLCDQVDGAFAAYERTNEQRAAQAPTQQLSVQQKQTANDRGSDELHTGNRIGKFEIIRRLGRGGFGSVYLARDHELNRLVAVKVAHVERLLSPSDAAQFRNEAQNGAQLHHPGITPVYSLEWDLRPPLIVQKYIEGGNLKQRMSDGPMPFADGVRITIEIADAISHAHQRGIYHRDLKPSNILLTRGGSVRVADFGQSLHVKDRRYRIGERCGTLCYMAPEQLRGESHRLDGRCDIWSLGVILYELVTGRMPYSAIDAEELEQEIRLSDPQPLRQVIPGLPAEAERICLKCLARRIADRYTTAFDLATDLRRLEGDLLVGRADETISGDPVGTQPPLADVNIVPKGLRAFDENDADFFLDLLPGPRDRRGLPDSVRFWKHRLEETDSDKTFSVGLIYGPSGCGKSSFMRAGLLPRLSNHLIKIYIEADGHETSQRILRQLQKYFPSLSTEVRLRDAMEQLRSGSVMPLGKKVVIVIDQLEQCLHAAADDELIPGLRQCDGGRIQSVVLVRDDFWLKVSRFMRELEVRIVVGENSALVDLLDTDHATRVLAALGRAFNRLPAAPATLTATQRDFLRLSIALLARDGKVNCALLALFAEITKNQPWTRKNLKRSGGIEGIGCAFLDATFGPLCSPAHRVQRDAALAVLAELLPPASTEIRGHMRSYPELQRVSGYERPEDFKELLQILDSETRLITPTDPDGAVLEGGIAATHPHDERYYQLTHDYLVPSLREWLARKNGETWRGRVKTRLADLASLWGERREARYLPSGWEWLCIGLFTNAAQHTDVQRKMMRSATRHYGVRVIAIVLTATLMSIFTLEVISYRRAYELVQTLRSADINAAEDIIEDLNPLRSHADPLLRKAYKSAPTNSREKLKLSLGLLPADEEMADIVLKEMLEADAHTVVVLRSALRPHQHALSRELWRIAKSNDDPSLQFRAALVLASFKRLQGDDADWNSIATMLVGQLLEAVATNVNDYGPLVEALRPVSSYLVPSLREEFQIAEPSHRRSIATNVLADFAQDDVEILTDLAMDADALQFRFLFPRIQRFANDAADAFRNVLLQQSNTTDRYEADIRRQSNAAVGLYRLSHEQDVWKELSNGHSSRLRAYVLHRLQQFGADPNAIARGVIEESDVPLLQVLLLALGDYSVHQIDPKQLLSTQEKVDELFNKHPSAGIHSSCEWLLRQQPGYILPDKPLAFSSSSDRPTGSNWRVTEHGHTLVMVDGSKDDRVGRVFEIATKEVTVEQYQRLFPDYQPYLATSPTPDCPVNVVSWYDAVEYCRRLSAAEGLTEEEMCYPPPNQMQMGNRTYPSYLDRPGYRLPTEAEWERACRGGTNTTFFFGEDPELLRDYAWFIDNSSSRMWPVGKKKPNAYGLFDIYGNAMEWCDDQVGADRALRGGSSKLSHGQISSDSYETYAPTTRFYSNSFRVVRTCRPGKAPQASDN